MPLIKTIAKYIFYMEEFGTFQRLPTYPKIRMEILAFPGLDPACHSGLIMYPTALLTGQQLPTPPYIVNSTSFKNLIQSLFPHRNSFLASQPNHFALAYNLEQDNLLKSFVTYTYVIFLSLSHFKLAVWPFCSFLRYQVLQSREQKHLVFASSLSPLKR